MFGAIGKAISSGIDYVDEFFDTGVGKVAGAALKAGAGALAGGSPSGNSRGQGSPLSVAQGMGLMQPMQTPQNGASAQSGSGGGDVQVAKSVPMPDFGRQLVMDWADILGKH